MLDGQTNVVRHVSSIPRFDFSICVDAWARIDRNVTSLLHKKQATFELGWTSGVIVILLSIKHIDPACKALLVNIYI